MRIRLGKSSLTPSSLLNVGALVFWKDCMGLGTGASLQDLMPRREAALGNLTLILGPFLEHTVADGLHF